MEFKFGPVFTSEFMKGPSLIISPRMWVGASEGTNVVNCFWHIINIIMDKCEFVQTVASLSRFSTWCEMFLKWNFGTNNSYLHDHRGPTLRMRGSASGNTELPHCIGRSHKMHSIQRNIPSFIREYARVSSIVLICHNPLTPFLIILILSLPSPRPPDSMGYGIRKGNGGGDRQWAKEGPHSQRLTNDMPPPRERPSL